MQKGTYFPGVGCFVFVFFSNFCKCLTTAERLPLNFSANSNADWLNHYLKEFASHYFQILYPQNQIYSSWILKTIQEIYCFQLNDLNKLQQSFFLSTQDTWILNIVYSNLVFNCLDFKTEAAEKCFINTIYHVVNVSTY